MLVNGTNITEMGLMVVALLLSLVVIVIYICSLYFCTCCQPIERDRNLPRTNHIQTIAYAPEDDWSLSASHVGQEFQHLFNNADHVNDDIDQHYHSNNVQMKITSNDIDDGFNRFSPDIGFIYPLTSRDYGFNYPNFDYGFIYPNNDHSLNPSVNVGASNIDHNTFTNIQQTRQYYLVNENQDFNQSPSRHAHKPLKTIITPPPSYFEAIKGYQDSGHQQNYHNNFDRGSHSGGYGIGSSKRKSGMRGVRKHEIHCNDDGGGVANATAYNSGRGEEGNGSEYRDGTDSVKSTRNSGSRSDDGDYKDGGNGGGNSKE